MMNEAAKADSDSLMALQALLKFRSDSVAESEETVPRTTSNMTCLGAAAKYENPTENRRKRPAPPMKHQQQRIPPPGTTLSHVTPPFGASSPRSALSPTFTLGFDMQNNTHLASAPFSPQVEPVAVSSAAVSLQGMTSNGSGGSIQANQVKKANETVATKPAVRTTEIEAALRSKPQRGRKRDNLSALERLELTRTRNREHAKSTR